MAFSIQCNPPDLGTVVTLKPITHHALKDPATGCIKVRGEGSVIKPKAQGGDVAEKSLVGRPCNRLLEKLGKTGCPLSPFPSPPSTMRYGLVNSCYKNSFFWTLKQAQGHSSILHAKQGVEAVLTANQNQTVTPL